MSLVICSSTKENHCTQKPKKVIHNIRLGNISDQDFHRGKSG